MKRTHRMHPKHRPIVWALALAGLSACASNPVPPPAAPTATPARAPAAANAPQAPAPSPARAASSPHAVEATPAPPAPAPSLAPPTGTAASRLAQAIDAYIDQPRFEHADWGISVVDLDTQQTIYAHRAGKLFIPASNAKLYTAALALETLGPAYRFRTSLYATRHPDGHGVLRGDLVLYGRGDPSLGSGNSTQPPTAWADQLAGALRARGVHRVQGDVIADDTYFSGPPFGSGWEASDLESGYAPGTSALSANGNTFTLALGGNGACCTASVDPAAAGVHLISTLHAPAPDTNGNAPADPLGLYRAPGSDRLYIFGSRPATQAPRIFTLSVPDPAKFTGGLLTDALARQNIDFDGQVLPLHWPQSGMLDGGHALVHITDVRSAPLKDLIVHMLKESDNLYAQLLLMAVGHQTAQSGSCTDQKVPPTLTAEWGLCALRAMTREIGMPPGSTHFEEGSGLSRKDLVTPEATTQLLAWIDRQPFAADLRQALPQAGVDGTLEYRLRGPLTDGRLEAKTGTLHYAYTLSGYVTAANGSHLAFSIMLNNYARPVDADGNPTAVGPRKDIDAVARAIAGYGLVSQAPAAPASAPASASSR